MESRGVSRSFRSKEVHARKQDAEGLSTGRNEITMKNVEG